MFFMKKHFRSRGETIIEILVAMTVLTLIITSTYSVLLRATKTNTNIKNRIIALNIAREGLEGVRNIRDTNWLRYSGDRRNKWLCRDAFIDYGETRTPCTDGSATPYDFGDGIKNWMLHQGYKIKTNECSDTLESGYYILERIPAGNSLLLTGGCNKTWETTYLLEPKFNLATSQATLDANREEFRLYYDSGHNDLVRHSSARGISCFSLPCVADPSLLNTPTPFYRKIKMEIVSPFEDPDTGIENDPNNLCESSSRCDTAKVKMTSIVEWQESGEWQKVTLEGHLFDFYERTDY